MRHVYVVDDDDAVRASLLGLIATRRDVAARGFPSGDAFLDALAELAPGVLLLDVHMPGRSGLEVLSALRARGFASLLVTGQGNAAIAVQAMKNGAFDFIEKPYDPELLLDLIEAAFAHLDRTSTGNAREQEAIGKIERLSPREHDVLAGLIAGKANKVIAYELDISPRTIEIHRANLMTKLDVRSLPDALRIAFAAGLIGD